MVLTGAAFVHLNYLKMFNSTSATPKAVHELIDELHNCEDLAVNVMVGDYLAKVERPQCSGLFVKPTKVINLEKETGKFAILLSLPPSFPYHQSISSSLLFLPFLIQLTFTLFSFHSPSLLLPSRLCSSSFPPFFFSPSLFPFSFHSSETGYRGMWHDPIHLAERSHCLNQLASIYNGTLPLQYSDVAAISFQKT